MSKKPLPSGKRGIPKSREAFSNHEIATLAVYLLGGQSTYVDTEDIAIKANEIAPGRFSWRKYPNQINLEIIRVYLSDAKNREKGAYLLGSGSDGWLLTEQGLQFAQNRVRELEGVNLTRKSLSPKEQKTRRHERMRMLGSDAFAKFQAGRTSEVTRHEAEAFFRLDNYIVGDARERKIVRIVNTFGDDPELGQAVNEFARMVRAG